MKTLLCRITLMILMIIWSGTVRPKSVSEPNKENVEITYLGHSGWMVKHKNNALIFDYQEICDFNWEIQPKKNLKSGYILTEEIKNYNVYVFTSHEHIDHYDPLILDWDKDIENITYFFGWDFSLDAKYNCLKAPRSEYKDEKIEVYTINSHHSGVPESAFLVKIKGLTIYHNGDYKGDYKNDFKYLKSKVDKIDIAFSNSDPYEGSQYIEHALILINNFRTSHFFPMHSINKESSYERFASMLYGKGVKSKIYCAKRKGDKFLIKTK